MTLSGFLTGVVAGVILLTITAALLAFMNLVWEYFGEKAFAVTMLVIFLVGCGFIVGSTP